MATMDASLHLNLKNSKPDKKIDVFIYTKGDPNEEQMKELIAYGVKPTDKLREATYLSQVPAQMIEKLASLPFITHLKGPEPVYLLKKRV